MEVTRPTLLTALHALLSVVPYQHMSPLEVRRKSISLDCDTIYFSDVLGAFRTCADGCGCSFYFEDEGDKVRCCSLLRWFGFFHQGACVLIMVIVWLAVSIQQNY